MLGVLSFDVAPLLCGCSRAKKNEIAGGSPGRRGPFKGPRGPFKGPTRGWRPRYKRLHAVLGAAWGPLAGGGTPRGPSLSRRWQRHYLRGGYSRVGGASGLTAAGTAVPSLGGAGPGPGVFTPGWLWAGCSLRLRGGSPPALGHTPVSAFWLASRLPRGRSRSLRAGCLFLGLSLGFPPPPLAL